MSIDAVDEVTEGAADPVRLVTKASTRGHRSLVCAYSRLLVD